jgi:hypothetical protein
VRIAQVLSRPQVERDTVSLGDRSVFKEVHDRYTARALLREVTELVGGAAAVANLDRFHEHADESLTSVLLEVAQHVDEARASLGPRKYGRAKMQLLAIAERAGDAAAVQRLRLHWSRSDRAAVCQAG